MATLGGLGSTNSFANKGYASNGSAFAADAFQAEHPCYVLNITVPYEACVNYEAELAYIYPVSYTHLQPVSLILARMAKTSAADVAAEVFAMLSSFSRASAQQKKKR